jgi:hypothetical protein
MISCLRLKSASLLIISFAFIGISCSQKNASIEQIAPLPENICRVAVLPFLNQSGYRDGDILFYRVFDSEISRSGNFEIVPEGDIRRAFRQVRLTPGAKQPNYDQLRIMGDYLNADVLIAGNILQMEELTRSNESIPYITVRLELLDAKTGKTIWSIYHVRNGSQFRKVMHFGVINTVTQLAKQMTNEIMLQWSSKGFIAQCTE